MGRELGCRTLAVFKGAGFGRHAQPSATILWDWRFALRYLQLLSPAAPSRNAPGARHVCEDTRRGAAAPRIFARRICHHARACASADERAAARRSVEVLAGTETAGFARVTE